MKIWLMTEERPKKEVVLEILKINYLVSVTNIELFPKVFYTGSIKSLGYQVKGISVSKYEKSNHIIKYDDINILTVSGYSSFFDYMVIEDNDIPIEGDITNVQYVVEETKTDDGESRNTGVYQRASKFVYSELYIPGVPKYMLYNYQSEQKLKKPSDTNIFGTNLLLTIGAIFIEKDMRYSNKFSSIKNLIDFKNHMQKSQKKNVPIKITQSIDSIDISGRLSKPATKGNIGHDPNIGVFSSIAASLRKLGWKKKIIITHHGVSQEYVNKNFNNKFMYICKILDIELENILIPLSKIELPKKYWYYENNSEKIGTILTHLYAEEFKNFKAIYENHAGCERGYFFTSDNKPLVISKKDNSKKKIHIPDLILYNKNDKLIILIEGKKDINLKAGLNDLNNYDLIEQFIKKHYPTDTIIIRKIVLYGGVPIKNSLGKFSMHPDVLLHLYSDKTLSINENAPASFKHFIPDNRFIIPILVFTAK